MKKAISKILAVCGVIVMAASAICFANNKSKTMVLQINNPYMAVDEVQKEIDSGAETKPIIMNGSTLLPIRAVVEEMGGTVNWNKQAQQITLSYNDNTIVLFIGSTNATVNSESHTLDTAPILINGKTFLPIRFIAENFGYNVNWNGAEKTITISGKNNTESNQTQTELTKVENTAKSDSNILIAYFSLWGSADYTDDVDATTSASINVKNGQKYGTTETAARMIQETVGGDLFRIETDEKYSDDFNTVIATAREERSEEARPIIKNKIENIDQYDTIFIGYPVWSSTTPNVILSFLEEYNLSGKTVIPFCTHDGYGSGRSYNVIKEESHATNVLDGIAIASDEITSAENDIIQWLSDIGMNKQQNNNTASGETAITIQVGEHILNGVLYDTALAQEIKEQFPLTISMVGYGNREYYGGVDFYPENVEGGQKTFENGDITYCEAHHNMAIFYAQTENPNLSVDVISIGKVTSDLSIFDNIGSTEEITFSLAE